MKWLERGKSKYEQRSIYLNDDDFSPHLASFPAG